MKKPDEKTTLIASPGSWIEGEALRQLERVATLPGMVRVAGFPDLHPGKGGPVGAAMLSEGVFYPYLVGSDVGCGMALFATELGTDKAKPEKWAKKLKGLEAPWDGDAVAWLRERGAEPEGFASSVGTIGMGNHFAELLRIHEVIDDDSFRSCGLDEKSLYLLVHSGSRGLGELILRRHVDAHRDGGLSADSDDATAYRPRHDNALAWASAGRELIARRFLDQLGSDYRRLLDLTHNSITSKEIDGREFFLHRKGAAPSDQGLAVIPGSRGALSFLVMPSVEQESNLWSVAHGAGRKWSRSECEGRLRAKFPVDSMRKTRLGSYVICGDRQLLYEEAPQAYKDIETVVDDMVGFGLIRKVASFAPLVTYKVGER
jgi:release factor H-coupled RctB family protein